jgi:hypothetical protein
MELLSILQVEMLLTECYHNLLTESGRLIQLDVIVPLEKAVNRVLELQEMVNLVYGFLKDARLAVISVMV